MPMPHTLQLLRAGMNERAPEWPTVREGLQQRGLALMSEGALVRVPKGFESALIWLDGHRGRMSAHGCTVSVRPSRTTALTRQACPTCWHCDDRN
jgi:uncharacterized protein (DUF2461 family)